MLYREPNKFDRPCDTCGEAMIGVMRRSYPPIRTTCVQCKGAALEPWKQKKEEHVKA